MKLETIWVQLALITASVAHNILDFGAIVDESTHSAELANSEAILNAILAADSDDNDDGLVEIPSGMTFSSLPVRTVNLTDVTIQIDGTLLVSKDFESFPAKSDFLMFFDARNLTFKGQGVIDGQGYMWWIREYLRKNVNGRPNLVIINECSNIEWSGIRLLNSP